MRIEQLNGVQQNSYTPQTKPVEQTELIKPVIKTETFKPEDETTKITKKSSLVLEKFKSEFDAKFVVANDEEMDEIKRNPEKFSTNTTVFVNENELEKVAQSLDYAIKSRNDLKNTLEKLPEIKNELDKKGAPVSNMGVIFDNGRVSSYAQLDKNKQKSEIDKLTSRVEEKSKEHHEEEVKEIRKKYAPKKRPSDDTTVIEREDKIIIISNSILDLTAAISDFGMNYFINPQDIGVNVDAKA